MNCYAEAGSVRNPAVLGIWGPNGTRVVAAEAGWRKVLSWDRAAKLANERHRVFCASWADWLEDWRGPMVDSQGRRLITRERYEWEPSNEAGRFPAAYRWLTMDDVRVRLLNLISRTTDLDYMLLTKRIENAERCDILRWNESRWPELLPHAWLGVTVEDRKAKKRIDVLRRLKACVRFLSVEPLLEDLGELDLRDIHLVIVGGESGPKARPCNLAWIRSVRDQCEAAAVHCFIKQLGSRPFDSFYRSGVSDQRINLRDHHGGDWSEWSEDLRVRQMPRAEAAAHA